MILSWRELSSSQDSRIRVFGSLYINKMFCSLQGNFLFGKKSHFSQNQKQLYKKPKKLLHIFSKEKEKEFSFCKHKSIRTNQKQKLKFFFFSILLLKQHSFKSNKRQDLNFQAKNTNKTVNTL